MGAKKIRGLSGYSRDQQKRASLKGSRNIVVKPLSRWDYLDTEFLKRQIAWVVGSDIHLMRGNTYQSLPRLTGCLSIKGQRLYGQHYYYESESDARIDAFRSQYYVVKTGEVRHIPAGKARQPASVWRPGERSRFTRGPFRPYDPAWPPGLTTGDTLNPDAFWQGFLPDGL
jgi:hypothetical protein